MSMKKSTKKGYKADAEPMDDEDEALAKAKKAEGDDEADDEEEEDEEDGEDEDGAMDKALLAEEDLEKALEGLGKKAHRSREAQLLAKGANLSKAEKRELAQILAGAKGSSLTKALSEDETLSKAVDVSPALESLASRVSSAVDDLGEKLEKSLDDQGDFNAAMGRSLVALGEIVRAQNAALKSLGDKLEKALDAPARAPKAVAGKKPDELEKGVDADAKKTSNRDTLVKALEAATHDAISKGDVNKAAALRGDLARALSGGTLSPVGRSALAAMQKS